MASRAGACLTNGVTRALRRLLAVLLVACAVPARALPPPPAGAAVVTFEASSTLHDFAGAAPAVAVQLRPAAVAGHWDADVRIPVATLSTGNAIRDGGMRGMLHADRFPALEGTFRDVDPDRVRATHRLPVVLHVAGVARSIEARLEPWQEREDRLAFDAVFDVSLAAFGLEAPSVAFVQVDDVVHVRVHVTLARAPA